jgi:hypothetical protein
MWVTSRAGDGGRMSQSQIRFRCQTPDVAVDLMDISARNKYTAPYLDAQFPAARHQVVCLTWQTLIRHLAAWRVWLMAKLALLMGNMRKKMLAKRGPIGASSILSNIYLSCVVTEQKL